MNTINACRKDRRRMSDVPPELKARSWAYAAKMLESVLADRPGMPRETSQDRELILGHIGRAVLPSLRTRACIIRRRIRRRSK